MASTRRAAKAFPISRRRPGCGAATPETHRRNDPRRHQFSPSEQPRRRRCSPSGAIRYCQRADVDNVVSYVQSLSDPAASKEVPAAKLEAGKAVFAANCASCHGDDGKGNTEIGAPDLTDKFWIYGGDAQTDRHNGLERPAGTHADMGRPTVAARPQDSRALSCRSEVGKPMSREHCRPPTAPNARQALWLFVGLALFACRRCQRASRLRRDNIPAGLRRSCPPRRRHTAARIDSVRQNLHARRAETGAAKRQRVRR